MASRSLLLFRRLAGGAHTSGTLRASSMTLSLVGAGSACYLLSTSSASCESEQPASSSLTSERSPAPQRGASSSNRGPETLSQRQLREAIESGYLLGIAGFGTFAILGILFLAWRTDVKSAKAYAFVALADGILNRNSALVSRVGRITSSGSYRLGFEPSKVEGWYQIESPARRIKGVAFVSAVKNEAAQQLQGPGSWVSRLLPRVGDAAKGSPAPPEWHIKALRVEFDREQLQESDRRRVAVSAAAGYRQQGEVQGAADAAGTNDVLTDDGEKTRVVLQVV